MTRQGKSSGTLESEDTAAHQRPLSVCGGRQGAGWGRGRGRQQSRDKGKIQLWLAGRGGAERARGAGPDVRRRRKQRVTPERTAGVRLASSASLGLQCAQCGEGGRGYEVTWWPGVISGGGG